MLWSVAQNVGRQAAGYLVFVVLAALLAPDVFGVAAIGAMWVALSTVFVELGFGAALVHREHLEPRHLSSAFALNLAAGGVLALTGAGAAPLIASLFQAPDAAPVIAALSATLIAGAAGATHTALAQRELRFRSLALRDITATLAGGVVGVVAALAGLGVWALVLQAIVTGISSTVLVWRLSAWRPRRADVDPAAVRELWAYSRHLLVYGVFKFAVQNTDRVLVGSLLGARALGIYVLAWRLVLTPIAALSGSVGAWLFPALARLQATPAAAAAVYRDAARLLAVAATPVLGALAGAAHVGIPVILGPQWSEAIPVVLILTLVGLGQMLISPVGNVMKAVGKPHWLLRWSIWHAAVIAGCVTLGSRSGVTGVAWGLTIAHAIALPVNGWMLWRMLPFRPGDAGSVLGPGLLAGASLLIAARALLPPPPDPGTPPALLLALGAGAVVGAGMLWVTGGRATVASWRRVIGPRTAAPDGYIPPTV